MGLNLSVSNDTVSTKIYDKQDDFDFGIVNFPFLDGDVPRRTSYGVYISQLIRFARASSNVSDFSCRNEALTAKLLKQGYRFHKLRKVFSKFYHRHSELLEKYNVSLRKLLLQGISEPEFYGDLVLQSKKNCGEIHFFSEQFRKLINRYKRIGYNPYVMRQTACLVINPAWVIAMLHSLIARRRVGPRTQWRPRHIAFTSGLGLDAMSLAWHTVVQLVVSFNSGLQWGISQEYSFFVSLVIDLILCFRCDALIELGSHVYVFLYLELFWGPEWRLYSERPTYTPLLYTTARSKVMVPMFLFCVAL